jgi:hypothetical protein
MPDNPQTRDFGVLPGGHRPVVARVRSEMTAGHAFGQYLMSFIMSCGCGGMFLGAGALMFNAARREGKLNDPMLLGGEVVFLLCAAFFIGLTAFVAVRSNRWVELDGDIIRAKNLYTGRIVEKSVWDTNEIMTEVFLVASAAVHITEMFQGRVRGFAIRFSDLPKGIKVYRPEMQNVAELIQAIAAKLQERGEVVPEIINFEGRPMVRRLVFHPHPRHR